MSYINTVKKLNSDLLQLQEKYRNSPLEDQSIEKIIRLTNSLNTNSNNAISTLDSRFQIIYQRLDSYVENQKIALEENAKKYNVRSEATKSKYIDIVNELRRKNEATQQQIVKTKDELTIDLDMLIKSNEQKSKIIESDKQESKKRFDFQISNALDAYDKSILQYNLDKEEKIKKETKTYQNALVEFDREVINYIAEIEKRKIEYNASKQEFLDKLTNIENNKKQKLLDQSINLNKIINSLINDKNVLIDKARIEYQASINKSQEDRLKEQQGLKIESNNIQKDFVYKITNLDEKESNLRAEFYALKHKETFNYLASLKRIQLIEETKIREIYKLFKNANSKELNKAIKGIKNSTTFYVNEKNRHYNKLIKDISLRYYKSIEELKHKKTLLEIEKNFKIEGITAKEQAINKYYQEYNSIYEATMNTSIKIANTKYNQKATQTKYQHDLKKIDIEKDFDVSEANFKKKLEMIEFDIRKADNEISSVKKLKSLLHNYEDTKYDRKKNYYNVNNLLEIEINKVLNNYNKRQYDFNIAITNLTASYQNGLLKHDEDYTKANLKLQKNMLNLKMQSNTQITGYKIYEQGLYEEYEKKINTANMAYENSIAVHTLLTSRFKEELKGINYHIFTISALFDALMQYYEKLIPIYITYFKNDLENVNSINKLLAEISVISTNYCRALINDYNDAINEIVYHHNEFEEKIKYKASYEAIVLNYENSKKRIIAKRNDVNISLEENNNSILDYKNRVYSYQNQIFAENNKNKKNRKYIKSLNQGLRDTKHRIKELNKLGHMLNLDLTGIDNELALLEVDYNQKIDSQKKLQYESSKTYYDLKKKIGALNTRIKNKSFNHQILLSSLKITNYEKIINARFSNYQAMILKTKKEIYKQSNDFIYLTNLQLEKTALVITNNHNENLTTIEKEKNSAVLQNQNQIDETESKFSTKRNWATNEIKQNETDFNNKLREYNTNYTNQNKLLIEKQRASLNDFYQDFNSMIDNKDELKKNFELTLKSIDEANFSAKNSLIRRDNEFDIQNKLDLNNFIKAKDDLINHLPLAVKHQSMDLNKELKEIDENDTHIVTEAKLALNSNIKQITRRSHEIKATHELLVLESTSLYQKNIIKSKKLFTIKMRKASKEKELSI